MNETVLLAPSTFGGFSPNPLDPLTKAGYTPIPNPYKRKLTAAEVLELGHECIGIISGLEPLTQDVLDGLPRLRCISRVGIGTDNIDLAHAREKGIAVCITGEAPIQSVTELVVGLLFALARQIALADRLIRQQAWNRLKGTQLAGKTVGVIGLGRIGRSVALTLQKLQLTVIGFDPSADPDWCQKQGIRLLPLKELLKTADIITLHVPRIPGSNALIGATELALMPPSALLINTSRGGVVDEIALYEALKARRLAGAALDVFEKEPYTGPLCELDNILLSPHMGTFTQEAREAMERDSVTNLVQALQRTQ